MVNSKLRIMESFSGIGSQLKAIKRLGIPHEVVAISEWEINASISYDVIHNGGYENLGFEVPKDKKALLEHLSQFTWSSDGKNPLSKEQLAKVPLDTLTKLYISQKRNNNRGSICDIKAEDIGDVDLFTYSFPCQDISVAGKQRGLIDEDGNITRSGLLFEALRLIRDKIPKYLLAENVKNLVGKQFMGDFKNLLKTLEDLGYKNYWKVLNAKDFGVPQNRERVFVVSIRKDLRQDYEFPMGFELQIRLKDILEDNVDERFYLNNDRTENLIKQLSNTTINEKPDDVDVVGDLWADNGHGSMAGRVYNTQGQCPTLGVSHFQQVKYILMQEKHRQPKILQVGSMDSSYDQSGRIYSDNGISPTIMSNSHKGGYIAPKVMVSEELPCIVASRGRNPENPSDRTVGSPTEQRLEANTQGVSNTLTSVQKDNYVLEPTYRIRKLTPKECIRLMDFDDTDYDRMKSIGMSDTQIYKQCGNSIVVACLEHIFRNMFLKEYKEDEPKTVKMKTKNGTEYEQFSLL